MLNGIVALHGTGVPPVTNSYESIATVTVGAGGQANVTFSSIPSGFKHLQIRYLARSTRAATSDSLLMQFNSDTGSNYNYHRLYGDGSTVTSDATTTTTSIYISQSTGANSTSGMFAAGVLDILEYGSTNINKTTRTLSGNDQNGSGLMFFDSGLWRKTPEAITSIVIAPQSGSHAQHSSFALYGIKG